MSSFVHLHVHSEYSLLEAAADIKSMVKAAAHMEQKALALTDHGNMYGAIEHFFACKDAGIKPILGLDAFMAPTLCTEKPQGYKIDQLRNPSQCTLLATSYQGYQSLCELSSRSFLDGFYYRPRIDKELLKMFSTDLICLTGGQRSYFYDLFVTKGPDLTLETIKEFKTIFPESFYLEINRLSRPLEQEYELFLVQASQLLNLPLVATNDVHYLTSPEARAQDVLYCIGNNYLLKDNQRPRMQGDQFYLKSYQEMLLKFKDHPEYLDVTNEIADRVNIEFKLKDSQGKPIYHLPGFPTPQNQSDYDYIKDQSHIGLLERFKVTHPNQNLTPEFLAPYYDRLKYELEIINRMGFNGYFLIVSDFIRWAKEQDIPVGPGRGSGAGSLVAYSLGITDVDPIEYKLLFERFLNPERISMPDFDIDFCQDRRSEVIQYVTQKYGQEAVSQIITYGKLQCKAAIKDVGRTLGMSFSEVDRITKLVPEKLGITIKEALKLEPKLNELIESDPQVANCIELALMVEGYVRHAGIHAAGVVIADGQIKKFAPLAKASGGERIVQYDLKHAEKIGLIKFDFLGLKTLTHIQRALKWVEINHKVKIKSHEIPVNDKGIYDLIAAGDTLGIFQFESEGITDAIKKIKPTNFYDITAINALYRPGPMAMIPTFTLRKNGQEPVEYLFDELKDVLQETLGIIVYQEQVMAIAAKIAGYSLGEADMLRRAMGKKIKSEMDQHRIRFSEGAKKNGFDEKKSEELFELMYKFADYGFNKSHAAAYCVISAQTAWIKCYYPVEFYAALLSTELSDTDKIVKYSKDAQKHGIQISPPHVNFSSYEFTPLKNKIYFGLGAIKGIGENVIAETIKARQGLKNNQFESLNQFFESVDPKVLNKKTLESLIKAGALDDFGYHRAQLFNGFSVLADRALKKFKEKQSGQGSLFDLIQDELTSDVDIQDSPEWSRIELLKKEKEVLGFYLSDHPLNGYESFIRALATAHFSELPRIQKEYEQSSVRSNNPQKYDFRNKEANKKKVLLAGIISEKRELVTKKGTRMAFLKIEDLTGDVALVVFPDVYDKVADIISSELPLFVSGYLESESDSDSIKVIVDNIELFENVISKIKRVSIYLDKIEPDQYSVLFDSLMAYQGKTPIDIVYEQSPHDRLIFELDQPLSISVTSEFIEHIQKKIGHTQFMELK